MRISDWSSDVCSSDLLPQPCRRLDDRQEFRRGQARAADQRAVDVAGAEQFGGIVAVDRAAIEQAPVRRAGADADRKSVVEGKSVSVRVALGGRSISKKQNTSPPTQHNQHTKDK